MPVKILVFWTTLQSHIYKLSLSMQIIILAIKDYLASVCFQNQKIQKLKNQMKNILCNMQEQKTKKIGDYSHAKFIKQ